MEPVVGVDVAKGSSVVQAFTMRNEPFGKLESIVHGESGFERLGDLLSKLQEETGIAPVVVLEATGHYHRSLVAYLERSAWTHFVVNPLQSKRAKGTQTTQGENRCRGCLALNCSLELTQQLRYVN